MNADMVMDFARDIANGMGHLHKENVLHCDLACRNLLVSYKGENKYLIKVHLIYAMLICRFLILDSAVACWNQTPTLQGSDAHGNLM